MFSNVKIDFIVDALSNIQSRLKSTKDCTPNLRVTEWRLIRYRM